MEIGIVGKPNVGKSTLFSSLTLSEVPIANYPFTTINPNVGVGYVRVECVCKEFNVRDNPRNSYCTNGNRFVPVKIIDTAGLVPDAWKGRGLGNQFLDSISKASLLIHLIDLSGSTDTEGRMVPPGSHDPLIDIKFLENELDMWFFSILKRHWSDIVKLTTMSKLNITDVIYKKLSGLKLDTLSIKKALSSTSEKLNVEVTRWKESELLFFAKELRRISKPIILAGNKIDYDVAEENLRKLNKLGYEVVPVSAISELILRKLANKGIIQYLPGDEDFVITYKNKLNAKQIKALERIKEKIFAKYRGTGVQKLMNYVVFSKLRYITVYPIRDPNKLTDSKGNVLPDVYLVPEGTTLRDFAYIIHTDLGKTFLFGLDVRRKIRLKGDYILKNKDVITIVSAQ